MRRDYGWSPRGARVFGGRPARTWKTLTLIGAIRVGAKPLLMTLGGAVNGRTFLAFVKQRLARFVRRGDVVVMDNLGAHKMAAVREAIEELGATPVYLPTYSPELNPIELWWAHIKRALRSLAVDAQDLLAKAVRRLRAQTSIDNISAWFRCAFHHSQSK